MLSARDIRRMMADGAEDALMRAAREVKVRADRDVPVGDPAEDPDSSVSIRRSGYIRRQGERAVEIGYSTPYAAKQHEDQHLKHPRGGKAKWLEDALKAEIPRLEGIVASEVRARMTGRRR